MALRGKKPEVNSARLKTLLYANGGTGKTHFCCSFPDSYYIDTEGLEDYPQFVKMIRDNNGMLVYLTEMSEIIGEVKELLSAKHNFKTLIIDSISFPYGLVALLEADRLAIKNPDKEGTEFGANVAKAKRLAFHLGMLLSRLDMNVIVTAHEKAKFIDNKDAGKTFDVSDKIFYALGSAWNLRLLGKTRKLFVEKSRYEQLKVHDFIDFDNGFEVLKNLFGEEIFIRESKVEELATLEQMREFKQLVEIFKLPDETVQKWLMASKATQVSEMSTESIQKYINKMNEKLTKRNAA